MFSVFDKQKHKNIDIVCLQILCAEKNPISMTPMKAYHATSPHKCKHTDMWSIICGMRMVHFGHFFILDIQVQYPSAISKCMFPSVVTRALRWRRIWLTLIPRPIQGKGRCGQYRPTAQQPQESSGKIGMLSGA